MTTPNPAILVSIDDAARMLAVGKRKVEELIAGDHIETVLIGRRRLVPVESLTEYVARLKASA